MNRTSVLLTLFVLFFYSCTSSEDFVIPTQPAEEILVSKISIPDPNSELTTSMIKRIVENVFTSTSSRGICNLDIIPFKGKGDSVIAYIVNRGDNNGYVIISADKQSYPIIAMSNYGYSYTKNDYDNSKVTSSIKSYGR